MTLIGWLLFALMLSAKALLVLAAALGLTRLMRDRSAAERHMVWVVASACVLALPVLSLAGPSWAIGVPSSWLSALDREKVEAVETPAPVIEATVVAAPAPEVVVVEVSPAEQREHVSRALGTPAIAPPAAYRSRSRGGPARVAEPTVVPAEEAVTASVSPVSPGSARLSPAAASGANGAGGSGPEGSKASLLRILVLLPLAVWVIGTLIALARMAAGMLGVSRVARDARPLLDAALLVRAHGTAAELGIERPIRFLEGDASAMPITFGVLRPTLLLPSSARQWSRERQDAVLRHELEHIRRHDSLSQLIAELGCALYWFNPLMWYASRRLRVEREHACDDAVLAAGSRASDYAAELLDIARTLRPQRTTEVAAIAMAGASHLRVRVSSVLDVHRRRERPSAKLLVPVWLGALLLITPLSAVALDTGSSINHSSRTASAAGADAPLQAGAAVAEAAADSASLSAARNRSVQQDCLSMGRNSNVSSNTNDGRRTIKWSGSECSGEMIVEGDVRFDEAFTSIVGISRGGSVRITAEEDGVERSVAITPARTGVAHDYRVNGERHEFDAAAREWLSSTLLFTFRRFGFMAEERSAAILDRGGVDALLAEVDLLGSDYVRSSYLTAAIERGRLDDSELDRVLTLAGTSLDSDYYRTEIVTAVAGNYEFTDNVRDAYIRAVRSIDSDYHQHQAYSSLLNNGRLTPDQVSAVLRETTRLKSDYYRAALLNEMATAYSSSPDIRPAYLAAATDMDSDHYKTGVLMLLLAEEGLSSEDLSEVIDAAATLDSDHYTANLLTEVVQKGLEDSAVRAAFRSAATRMGSDHHLATVLRGLAARDRLDESALMMLLETAEAFDSDFYLSEVLIDVARQHRLDGDVRERFERLMNELESKSRRERVSEAVRRSQ
ncbi:MAG TPA: M56 family metallopeptidase [Longimicrobiales bacterium]|nr:M56 family metallopeptidase [Longimicrobiales bacterium]